MKKSLIPCLNGNKCVPLSPETLERLVHLVRLVLVKAPVAELVDAPGLGSGVPDVQVRVLSGAPFESNGQISPKTVSKELLKVPIFSPKD